MTNDSTNTKKQYGFWAFTPLLVFLVLFLGSGIFFTVQGTVEKPFGQVPVLAALLVGVVTAFLMNPRVNLDRKIEAFTNGIADGGVLLMVLIFLFAGAFSSTAKAMGGVDSVVNLGLSVIPAQFLVPGIFLIGAFISTATGTCLGTIVTVAPIAMGVVEATSINPALAMGAVFGGSMFGDNLSVISDTTIAATRGVGAQMKDKFRMNFVIALPAAILATVAFALAGSGVESTVAAMDFNLIKIIPYLVVLISAIAGMNVIAVLISGTVLSGVIGLLTGSIDFVGIMQAISSGMSGMVDAIYVALLVRGIVGLVQMNGGIEWLVGKMSGLIKSRRGAEYSIALTTALLSFSLLDNTVAILTTSPIAKAVGDQYKVAPKRLASLLDIFACVALCLAPHSSMITILSTASAMSPFSIIQHCYYQIFLGIAALITIQFGLLRTKEEKALSQ